MILHSSQLSGVEKRAYWLRLDAAAILERLFLCERSLIISQAAWLPGIAPLEVKLTLPRFLWEDAMTAQALRDRVFELRFPSRVLEPGADAPLIELIDQAINAPSGAAYVLSLARVFKPALLAAYQEYLTHADEIADGPTLRFLRLAVQEKQEQIQILTRFAGKMLAANPNHRSAAENWVTDLRRTLRLVGGISIEQPDSPTVLLELRHRQLFQLIETPARDDKFYNCRYYWPDIVEPEYPYGEGVQLQLRSAISHLNEVWAVETVGAVLHSFAGVLGWEFIFEAARWCYDESRHSRMGQKQLLGWGFEPQEIPMGSYFYDCARGQEPIYRLGMLSYFETKNIGKKLERAAAFAQSKDRLSERDMEFDWADEALHAHFGQRWLKALHELDPKTNPTPEAVRERCEALVVATTATATDKERHEIRQVAEALLAKADKIAALP